LDGTIGVLELLCRVDVVYVMQMLLHVCIEHGDPGNDAAGDESIAVQRAGCVTAVRQLTANGKGDFGGRRLDVHDILVALTAVLTSANEDNGRAEIARVTHEAAGISDGTRRTGEDAEIILGTEVRDRPQPCRVPCIPEYTDGLADVVGPGVDIWPQQNRLLPDGMHRFEEVMHLRGLAAELGRGGMEHTEHERLVHVNRRSVTDGVQDLGIQPPVQRSRDIAARAAHRQYGFRPLAHANEVLGRALCGGYVKVRELGNRVPRTFIDRAGDFPALNVHDAKIHVGGCNGGRQGLIAVPDQQNDIRAEPLEFTRKLDNAEAQRLGHRGRVRAFQFQKDLAVYLKSVLTDDLYRVIEPLQDHGSGGNELERHAVVGSDRLYYRLQPAVVCTINQHNCDFAWCNPQNHPPRAACLQLLRASACG
jgi:hypothetical protein